MRSFDRGIEVGRWRRVIHMWWWIAMGIRGERWIFYNHWSTGVGR